MGLGPARSGSVRRGGRGSHGDLAVQRLSSRPRMASNTVAQRQARAAGLVRGADAALARGIRLGLGKRLCLVEGIVFDADEIAIDLYLQLAPGGKYKITHTRIGSQHR